ncbi:ester cyclase [Chitinophaga agrisoli]|uniref:Ester cyclase n=1 Tax=Chitinophaga agrisoli TaxID=2607653 RepID=A0A5B2VJ37_9BACT|nr:ester cyclase [Chitinophaga agrisoli]KAA2238955.1 ester cyclase [Chitinophaga agrisoli]
MSEQLNLAALTPVEKVLHFWNNVWSHPYNLDLIDELMVEDFTITNAGTQIKGRDNFKQWVHQFLQTIHNANLETLDIFESKDGTRVVSRWKLTGIHNGMLGLAPNQKPVELLGTAVWEIRDNKLAHNWVERNSWELYHQLK